ncbi:glutamyl-tRNA amidotransferase subunit A [Lyngbya sp. PCC 8106]|nr:glutamyl-tRNA amidotransferase subunit A [Lyngbya sp. PCC 8106]
MDAIPYPLCVSFYRSEFTKNRRSFFSKLISEVISSLNSNPLSPNQLYSKALITQFNRYHLKLIQICTEIPKVMPLTQHRADPVVLYNIPQFIQPNQDAD